MATCVLVNTYTSSDLGGCPTVGDSPINPGLFDNQVVRCRPCGSPILGQRLSILMAKWLKRNSSPRPKLKPTAMMNQCGVFRAAPERWLVLRHHALCMQADLLRWQVMRAFPSGADDCLWCVGWQRIHPLSVCLLVGLASVHRFGQVTSCAVWEKSNGDHPTAADWIGENSSLPPSSPPFSHRQHNRGGTMVNCWDPMGGGPRMVGGRHVIDSGF